MLICSLTASSYEECFSVSHRFSVKAFHFLLNELSEREKCASRKCSGESIQVADRTWSVAYETFDLRLQGVIVFVTFGSSTGSRIGAHANIFYLLISSFEFLWVTSILAKLLSSRLNNSDLQTRIPQRVLLCYTLLCSTSKNLTPTPKLRRDAWVAQGATERVF